MAVIGFFVRPWRGMTLWRSLAWQALDFPLGLVIGISITVLVALSVGLAVTFVIAIPLVWFTFLVAAQLGRMERSRAAALLGINLASPHAPLRPGNWWSHLRQRVTTASRWREIGYLSLGLPIQGVMGVAITGALVRCTRAGRSAGLRDPSPSSLGRSRCLSHPFGHRSSHCGGHRYPRPPRGGPAGDRGARCPRSEACAMAPRSSRPVRSCSASR